MIYLMKMVSTRSAERVCGSEGKNKNEHVKYAHASLSSPPLYVRSRSDWSSRNRKHLREQEYTTLAEVPGVV